MPSAVRPPTPVADQDLDSSSITAARLVAIAITALLVSFLVVNRTGDALSAGATTPPSDLRAASVSLTDDDGDRTLFDLDDLRPGRPVTNCIAVTYEGTAFGGTVDLRARGGGDLAPLVDLVVEAGSGGAFDDCDGFERDATLYHGTIAAMVDHHGPDDRGLPALAVESVHQSRSFRVTMTVRDDAAASGRNATIEFLWSVET